MMLATGVASALVARELTYLSLGETTLETTLSELLSLIDSLVMPRRATGLAAGGRSRARSMLLEIPAHPSVLLPESLETRRAATVPPWPVSCPFGAGAARVAWAADLSRVFDARRSAA